MNINMNRKSKILVAGGSGLVGSSLVKSLLKRGYSNVVYTVNNTDTIHKKAITFEQYT